MSDRGFFLVSRGLFEHPRFKPRGPFSDLLALLWLIETAAHTSRVVPVDCGSARKAVRLERGQLTYSIRYLARAWQWSDKRVQRFLGALKDDQTLTTATTTGQTIITLCNYDKHQRSEEVATTATTTPTTTQATTNKKQLKQLKEDIAPPAGFDEWYAIYPKKKAKQEALRAFNKVLGSGLISFPALIEKTRAFAIATNWAALSKRDRQFIPYPASWLNDGSYDDELDGGGELSPAPIDPRTFTDVQWRKRLTDTTVWMKEWGPKPGEPGCLVPPHLILSSVSSAQGAA
jgi:hypothetical protein